MLIVLNQGGLGTGGFNFDAKLRRESTDIEDLFIAHIGSMDAYAKGLKIAAKIIEEKKLSGWITERYSSYDKGIGAKIEAGDTNFNELSEWVIKNGEPELRSGKQEKYESLLMCYLYE
ncbi:MAG: xylose isomerase, partial [Chitinispirillia bacterium]|jgi:xylose isomerase